MVSLPCMLLLERAHVSWPINGLIHSHSTGMEIVSIIESSIFLWQRFEIIGCLARAVLSKRRVSMICRSASLTIGGPLSETPIRVAFLFLLNYLYISFEIIVSGCRSWNSLTSCPFQLWQP